MDNNGFGEGEDNADSVMGRGVVLGPNGLASNGLKAGSRSIYDFFPTALNIYPILIKLSLISPRSELSLIYIYFVDVPMNSRYEPVATSDLPIPEVKVEDYDGNIYESLDLEDSSDVVDDDDSVSGKSIFTIGSTLKEIPSAVRRGSQKVKVLSDY
jgi:hypothetical protein